MGFLVGRVYAKRIDANQPEIVKQLRNEAGKRDTNAETALTHNVGGSGGTSLVHIFGRNKK